MAARDSIPAELLADIKNYLGITWDDENTDRRVTNLAGAGMAYIGGKLGAEADFLEDCFSSMSDTRGTRRWMSSKTTTRR